MTTTQAPTATPALITTLATEVTAKGGTVREIAPRLFEMTLPRRVFHYQGTTKVVKTVQVNAGRVGYYRSADGVAHCRGMREVRANMVAWKV